MEILQEKPLRLLISNDAFYCLYYDEEPIDPANIVEAKEVMAKFPSGFVIEDGWQPHEDTGLIEVTLSPLLTRPDWPEYYLDIMSGWQLIFRFTGNEAIVQLWHETKEARPPENIKVEYFQGKPWITFRGSHYPLSGSKIKNWVP